MCRSSRILAFVCVVAATPAFGQARAVPGPVAAHIFAGAPRAAIRPGIVPGVHRGVFPNVRAGVAPGIHPNVFPNVHRGVLPGLNHGLRVGALRPRLGRFGRRGFGGSALGYAGLGLALVDDLPYPPPVDEGYGGGYGPEPPVIPAYDPPSCVRPLVIKVGNGLRRRAKTRIVYGSPPGCGRAYER